ncbi:MAG: 2-oxoglutarate dehydrogenase E1 component [Verrucomicrobiales bacterium]|nr:2-oxoglutarate dehydrogenase E1 component [Verrucomicrobiales bacterium]
MNSSIASRFNANLLDEKFALWRDDPRSVDSDWAAFFEGFSLGMAQIERDIKFSNPTKSAKEVSYPQNDLLRVTLTDPVFRARVVSLLYSYRALGHTEAWVNPLSLSPPTNSRLSYEQFGFNEVDLKEQVASQFFAEGKPMPLSAMIGRLQEIYCGKIGFEYMGIHNSEIRHWIRDRIENRPPLENFKNPNTKTILNWLIEAEEFENYLHHKFVAQKRFGLEGGESTLVALNTLLHQGIDNGVEEIVMGMAHRGRLNVLANFIQKPLSVLFNEFSENYVPDLVCGDGDVKYHLGYETRREIEGAAVNIFLAPNPSHLEAVNSVVEGMARARQRLIGNTDKRDRVLPILLHGDAAFAGQGAVAEVLNFSQLPGYRTGGTIHIIINNQIGFTTMPSDARSSVYCTDIAKMIEAPIFHVNGDSPLEVAYVTGLALEFRQKFGRDVVVDIVCYRRHGHNEADEPSFTQPNIYRTIRSKKSTTEIYKNYLLSEEQISEREISEITNAYHARLDSEFQLVEGKDNDTHISFRGAAVEVQEDAYSYEVIPTGIPIDEIRELGRKLVDIPDDFSINAKIEKLFLARRFKATEEGGPYDWAHAEALAFASLLDSGCPVRLSGQDVRRGTFSQRHCVLYDSENRERYVPLKNLSPNQASFCAYNSLLSESGVLGFDYGYNLMVPQMLICWEAQFGDFVNGAQVIIDQFISSAESKWGKPSNLVMLLPHGYEGQGPEHSSARLERFLQLCAGGNLQVCNLTSPAQYFHVLRRQIIRELRKPLILMSPKSLLRHPECVSNENDFSSGSHFFEMLDDDQLIDRPERVTRIIFCSGKVYYDLLKFRNENKIRNTAIIRIEQLYPFHWKMLSEIIERYPRAYKKWIWCQEEPLNMGAWSYISPRLNEAGRGNVRYAGRERSASTATGSKAIHNAEQQRLVQKAFSV